MRHEDSVGYKMRLIHNRIHKQMEAKRIENEVMSQECSGGHSVT